MTCAIERQVKLFTAVGHRIGGTLFVNGDTGKSKKKWDIPPVGGKDIVPIQSPESSKHFAKPLMRREVKYHARWLFKRLAEQYSYYGNLYIVKGLSEGVGDPSILKKWVAENKDMLSKGIINWSDFK